MAVIARKVCEKCEKNRALKFYRGDRGRICSFCRKRKTSVASRETRLWETYGITLEEYDEILAMQHGACFICEKVYKYNLDVDHDHVLQKWLFTNVASDVCGDLVASMRGSIRGLLCKRCNRRMLPAAADKPSVLRRAATYLEIGSECTQRVLALTSLGFRSAASHPDNGVDEQRAA